MKGLGTRQPLVAIALLCLSATGACAQEWPALRTLPVAAGLQQPVDIQSPRDGTGRLFIVEQRGRIRVLRDGALLAQPFLDITARVTSGGEMGLLGLAFPPASPPSDISTSTTPRAARHPTCAP